MATTTAGKTLSKVFGDNVRSRRKDLGYTQVTFARKFGFAQSYVSEIERGEIAPGFDVLKRLGEALECEVFELFK